MSSAEDCILYIYCTLLIGEVVLRIQFGAASLAQPQTGSGYASMR